MHCRGAPSTLVRRSAVPTALIGCAGRGATLDLRHKANTAAAALATGWGYWFIVPPLAGARRIRNDVWREVRVRSAAPRIAPLRPHCAHVMRACAVLRQRHLPSAPLLSFACHAANAACERR